MARTTVGVMAIVLMMTAGTATQSDAAPDLEPVVVLHVTDDAHVSPGVLAEAEKQATHLYRAAGVRTVWAAGAAQTAQPDGSLHLDVVLVLNDKMASKTHSGEITEQAFGRTSRPTKRAYVFYNPTFDHAVHTGSNVACLLAAVIAHEVGHILLPAGSHSKAGIMRATWYGRMLSVPGFTDDQGATMRRLLLAGSAN